MRRQLVNRRNRSEFREAPRPPPLLPPLLSASEKQKTAWRTLATGRVGRKLNGGTRFCASCLLHYHYSTLSIRYCPTDGTVDSPSATSKSGATSLIFSISRFIANGFGRKPRTPASFINSWARASSPRPEIKINGGTTSGGFT